MPSLISRGRLRSIADVAPDLRARCKAYNLERAHAYTEWIDNIVADYIRGRALILNAGCKIDGDLILDWTAEISAHNICAVIAPSDLDVSGDIINDNLDGGPLLFVDGSLSAMRILKGGAPLIILGDVHASGPIVCDYNLGIVRIAGNVDCEALVVLDQDVLVGGTIRGPIIDWSEGDTRTHLVPDVFPDGDDLPDGELLRSRILAGLPILR